MPQWDIYMLCSCSNLTSTCFASTQTSSGDILSATYWTTTHKWITIIQSTSNPCHSKKKLAGIARCPLVTMCISHHHNILEPTSWENRKITKKQSQKMEKEEIKFLQENKTRTLTVLPLTAKHLWSNWIFKVKINAEGNIHKYKTRFVSKGILPEIWKGLQQNIISCRKTLHH